MFTNDFFIYCNKYMYRTPLVVIQDQGKMHSLQKCGLYGSVFLYLSSNTQYKSSPLTAYPGTLSIESFVPRKDNSVTISIESFDSRNENLVSNLVTGAPLERGMYVPWKVTVVSCKSMLKLTEMEVNGSSWKTSAINVGPDMFLSALTTALLPVTWLEKRHWLHSFPLLRSFLASQNISISSVSHASLWRWNLPVILLWILFSMLSNSSRRVFGIVPLDPTPYLIISSLLISFSDFIVCHKSRAPFSSSTIVCRVQMLCAETSSCV